MTDETLTSHEAIMAEEKAVAGMSGKNGEKAMAGQPGNAAEYSGISGDGQAANEKRPAVVKLRNFTLSFPMDGKLYPAVKHLDLEIREGEMAALIGESGCGKSMSALSVIGLQPETAVIDGEILYDGRNILDFSEKEWSELRGKSISMVFQEPMTALNPLIRVGRQIEENILEHQKVSKREAREKAWAMMRQVGLPDVEALSRAYPHQLSGGQRQRIMIAMAFINNPALLIADEPTTALDVTIQAQIMQLMKKLNRELKTAVLLISHNLGLVRSLCSYVYIMYAGSVVEEGKVEEILTRPMHPYTRGLAAAIPAAGKRGRALEPIPGTVPDLDARPEKGCVFCGRCARSMEICSREDPPCVSIEGRKVFCHLSEAELTGKP